MTTEANSAVASLTRVKLAAKALAGGLGKGFRSGLEDLKNFDGNVRSFSTAIKGLSGLAAFKKNKPTLHGLTGDALKGTVSLAKKSIIPLGGVGLAYYGIAKAASDLKEQQNGARQTFSSYSDVVLKGANAQAKAFGTVKAEFLKAANSYGGIFKASGFGDQESANLSVHFTKLAEDLSSFKDLSFDEALSKIQAGLVGEVRPLREVGVLLSEAAVKQEAYRAGIARVGEELTDGQKVQGRALLITRQLSDANGDLARTFNDPANAARALRGRFINLAADFGLALEPITKFLLGGINVALADLSGRLGNASSSIKDWAASAVQSGGIVHRIFTGIGVVVGKLYDSVVQLTQGISQTFASILEGATFLPGIGSAFKPASEAFNRFNEDLQGLKLHGRDIQAFFNNAASNAAVLAKITTESTSAVSKQNLALTQMQERMAKVGEEVTSLNSKLRDDVAFMGLGDEQRQFFKARLEGASPESLTETANLLNLKQQKEASKQHLTDSFEALRKRADNPLAIAASKGSREAREIELRNKYGTGEDVQKRMLEAERKQVDYLGFLREDIKALPRQIAALQRAEAIL